MFQPPQSVRTPPFQMECSPRQAGQYLKQHRSQALKDNIAIIQTTVEEDRKVKVCLGGGTEAREAQECLESVPAHTHPHPHTYTQVQVSLNPVLTACRWGTRTSGLMVWSLRSSRIELLSLAV